MVKNNNVCPYDARIYKRTTDRANYHLFSLLQTKTADDLTENGPGGITPGPQELFLPGFTQISSGCTWMD
jgi:hypothetical protein